MNSYEKAKDDILEISQKFDNAKFARILDEAIGYTDLVDIIHELAKINANYAFKPYERLIFRHKIGVKKCEK